MSKPDRLEQINELLKVPMGKIQLDGCRELIVESWAPVVEGEHHVVNVTIKGVIVAVPPLVKNVCPACKQMMIVNEFGYCKGCEASTSLTPQAEHGW